MNKGLLLCCIGAIIAFHSFVFSIATLTRVCDYMNGCQLSQVHWLQWLVLFITEGIACVSLLQSIRKWSAAHDRVKFPVDDDENKQQKNQDTLETWMIITVAVALIMWLPVVVLSCYYLADAALSLFAYSMISLFIHIGALTIVAHIDV